MASDGRLRIGPCGHQQRAVIAQFFLCEGAPNCPGKTACKCGSTNVEPFEAPPLVPPGSFHCVPCGRVWNPGH